MPKIENIKNQELKFEMNIRGIELLSSSFQYPKTPNPAITNFNFSISIETRADAQKKNVFVIVHVDVNDADQSVFLGALSVSCIYEIKNFEEVIKIDPDGKLNMPQAMIDILNSISYSTVRGVMFSTFRGTFLHGAVLPIIDPKQIQKKT
ncbi:MAG: hypothetical protein KKA07_00070 [Bacteroidetes bacterium]|nr:hypothetical protein [Bacteroidota bacterium]MBU1717445.1 hypothetical protein [Bacteroidota bacterium]